MQVLKLNIEEQLSDKLIDQLVGKISAEVGEAHTEYIFGEGGEPAPSAALDNADQAKFDKFMRDIAVFIYPDNRAQVAKLLLEKKQGS